MYKGDKYMYKMILTDLDHTLLKSDGSISEKTIQILLWAIKNIQTPKPILHVAGWNEKAIVLYKNVGFEIIETIEI